MARRALAHVALAAIVAGCAALALFAAAHPSFLVVPSQSGHFPGWLAGPLSFPGLIPAASLRVARIDVTVILGVMLVAWLVSIWLAEQVSARLLWGGVIAAHVVIFLAPPIIGSDIYNYLGYARLQALFGFNPYTHSLLAAPTDPLATWTTWRHFRSPYGPLFTVLVEPFGHLGLSGGIWALKAMMTAASLGALWLVWEAARRLGRSPRVALAVCGLSPLWLIDTLAGFHNDLLLALAIAGTAALLAAGRPARGMGALMVGVALKFSAGVLVPLAVLGARAKDGAHARVRALVVAVGGGAAIAALVLILYGGGLPSLDQQTRQVSSLSAPNAIGAMLGLGGVTPGVRLALYVVLLGTLAVAMWRVWRGAEWLAWGVWTTIALMASLTWLEPWYVVWLLPLAALTRSKGALIGTLAVATYELVIWTPNGHVDIVTALGLQDRGPAAVRGVDVGHALRDSVSAGWPLALAGALAAAALCATLALSLRARRSAP